MFTHIVPKQRRRLSARYFAHEYLAPAWQPLYVTQVRAELATIGLRPVGSATLADNFDSFVLQAAQRDALAEIGDDDLRELVRDCMLMTRLRRDLFSRHAVAICADDQRRDILRLAIFRTRAAGIDGDLLNENRGGTVRFDNPLARRIVAALAHGPQPLRQLGEPNSELVTNALALASAGIIRPAQKRDTAVSALNDVLPSSSTARPFRYHFARCQAARLSSSNLPTVTCSSVAGYRGRLRAWPNFLAQAIRAKD